jgi:hypothetical protein
MVTTHSQNGHIQAHARCFDIPTSWKKEPRMPIEDTSIL